MNPRIFLGILSAVVGLLAVINPQSSIEAIVILIGIGAIVNGINSILKVKRFSFSPYFERTVIIRSVAGILVGILAVILPFAFFNMVQKIVRILLYIQAVFLLLSAISEFILVSGTENSAPFFNRSRLLNFYCGFAFYASCRFWRKTCKSRRSSDFNFWNNFCV